MNTESRSKKLAWSLMVTAVAAYMLLSAQMLLRLGIPYDAKYGPLVAKIHPGSYFLMLAWFAALASHGNPLRILVRQMQQHRLLACYLGCMVIVFVWVVLQHGGSGAAFIIEALWMPGIAALTLYLLDLDKRRWLVQLLMVLLTCNAVLAIGEALAPARITPLHPGDDTLVAEEYFRSSAFLGHPLHNAMITAGLLPTLTLLPWSLTRRLMIAVLLILSLLAFGGRASLVVSAIVYGSYAFIAISIQAFRGRFNYLQLTGGSLAMMLSLTGVTAFVAATGMGERIFSNLKLDSSAGVRLRVWDAFSYLSNYDLWMGISPTAIDHVSLRIGLDPNYEAIENFWIYLFMHFGIIGFTPFLIGLTCLVVVLLKAATPPMRAALLVYFIVASTANTLATKTMSLTLLTIAILAGEAFRPNGKAPIVASPTRSTSSALADGSLP
jgi:polysaccharide biosynthesis protein VpsF